ncbi:30S ribosomal chloroplastic-like [Chlorella sorokiniana]|uniref:Small ribosomal subunit protein uS17c n=1 Tax=Chlorella sorokiniana TaxID=3076 RepID=A0A2P6TBR9_CHLSO|nr:30S ribosomal chloroplastic-like [Chlorella sorokiniana]|eukprot:PRW18338.1 30S ribosomal chloroplastic-like [Chlorella sorokiniana]
MATEFVGKVISNRMQKSVLVAVDRLVKHKKYDRLLRRTTKLMAHDEANECNVGDTVRVHISRPLSKRKSWVVTQVLHRARVFDADSAAKAAAADAAAHHAGGSSGGGLGAPSFAASAVPSAQ